MPNARCADFGNRSVVGEARFLLSVSRFRASFGRARSQDQQARLAGPSPGNNYGMEEMGFERGSKVAGPSRGGCRDTEGTWLGRTRGSFQRDKHNRRLFNWHTARSATGSHPLGDLPSVVRVARVARPEFLALAGKMASLFGLRLLANISGSSSRPGHNLFRNKSSRVLVRRGSHIRFMQVRHCSIQTPCLIFGLSA